MRKPSNIRRFDRQSFSRLATLIPSKNPRLHNRKLTLIAEHARNKGYNARIVKNKNTSSVYVKPRKYNAPIPETDPERIKTFPTALRMMSEKSRKINQLESKGMDIIPRIDESFDLNIPGFISEPDSVKNQVKDQMREIQDFTDKNINENYVPIMENLRNIQKQAYENQFIEDFEDGASNLDESQWSLIQNQPQFSQWFDNSISELSKEIFPDLLAEYAFINDQDPNLWGDKILDQEFEVSRIGQYTSLLSENGIVLRTFGDDFIEKAKQESLDAANKIWRYNFALNMRQLGTSEHQVVAGLVNETYEIEALNQYNLLDYTNWDGWDDVKEDYESAQFASVPGMIDLPRIEEIPEAAIELKRDAEEKLQQFGRRLTLEKLTFDAEDLREVLKYTGWDRPEENYKRNDITRLGTEREDVPVIAQREDEIGENPPEGMVFVKAHYRKLPVKAFNRKVSKSELKEWLSMPIPEEYEPKSKMQMKSDRKKREIVRYLLYRNRNDLGPASTSDIVMHLDDRFKQGVTTNEVSNYLGRDNRFDEVGFLTLPQKRVYDPKLGMGMNRVRQVLWNLKDYDEVEPAFGGIKVKS